ncbi:MAG: hypothetical protein ACOYNL_05240 [Rickettsiales bacterium]
MDKPKRGVATLVYRGIVAVVMLVIPAVIAGAFLSTALPWIQLLSVIGLFVWFGHCFVTFPTLALLKRAKLDGLPLNLPNLNYLFADSHAVIRYLITVRMESFAVGIVGGCFWYVLGGWVFMAPYLVLATAAGAYAPRLAFGWAARGLFALIDAVPRLIARLLLVLAALFTPHTRPIAGLLAPNWRTAVAMTLDCSLGGPSPRGEAAWVGTGTPKATYHQLRRGMMMLVVAAVLLVLLLSASIVVNLLVKLI